MKNLTLLGFFCLLCLTTSAKRLGVYCFFADNGSQLYEDENVKLLISSDYEKNIIYLAIYNKRNDIIYVDKGNSFAYINGKPETLFKNSVTTTSNTTGSGVSVNLGDMARALRLSTPVANGLSPFTISNNNYEQRGTTVFEQRIISVAPNSVSIIYIWDSLKKQFQKSVVDVGDVSDMWMPTTIKKQGRFINSTGNREKFAKGLSKHYEEGFSPLDLKAVVKYSREENFASSNLVTVSNYVADMVIDSYKGINDPNTKLSYCDPSEGRSVYRFCAGGAWAKTGIGCLGITLGSTVLFLLLVAAIASA